MKYILLLFFIIPFSTNFSFGQFADWSFEGGTNAADFSTTVGVNASDATFGHEDSPSFPAGNNPSPIDAYSANQWSTASTIDLGDYIQFCVSPDNNTDLDISGISADVKRSGSGPMSYQIRYSDDGFSTFTTLASGSNSDDNWNNIGGAFFSTVKVTSGSGCFRIYGYAAGSGSGTWRFDNVRISGSVLPIELNHFKAIEISLQRL